MRNAFAHQFDGEHGLTGAPNLVTQVRDIFPGQIAAGGWNPGRPEDRRGRSGSIQPYLYLAQIQPAHGL